MVLVSVNTDLFPSTIPLSLFPFISFSDELELAPNKQTQYKLNLDQYFNNKSKLSQAKLN